MTRFDKFLFQFTGIATKGLRSEEKVIKFCV